MHFAGLGIVLINSLDFTLNDLILKDLNLNDLHILVQVLARGILIIKLLTTQLPK